MNCSCSTCGTCQGSGLSRPTIPVPFDNSSNCNCNSAYPLRPPMGPKPERPSMGPRPERPPMGMGPEQPPMGTRPNVRSAMRPEHRMRQQSAGNGELSPATVPDADSNIIVPAYDTITPASGTFDWNQYPIGMGYVPIQPWEQTYPVSQGLNQGTIFPSLDLPFMQGRCAR